MADHSLESLLQINKDGIKIKQAGAEQCQAQAKLEIGYKLSLDEHI